MFRPLSPFDMVQRVDVLVDDGVLTSGVIGSWVEIYQGAEASGGVRWPVNSTQRAKLSITPNIPAYVIWTESAKRMTGSYAVPTQLNQFTPDAIYTKKLTTLVGKWRALTNQVTGASTKTPGTILYTAAAASPGQLTGGATFSGMAALGYFPQAVVRNYYTFLDHMGVTYSGVWEIESLH